MLSCKKVRNKETPGYGLTAKLFRGGGFLGSYQRFSIDEGTSAVYFTKQNLLIQYSPRVKIYRFK
jgi:hypothetical protein